MNNELKIQLAQRLDSRDAKELLQNFTHAENDAIYDLREANDRQANEIAKLKRDNDSLVEKIKLALAAAAAAKDGEAFKSPKPGDWVIVAKMEPALAPFKVGDRVRVSYSTTCPLPNSGSAEYVCALTVDKYNETIENQIDYTATLPLNYFKPV